MTMKTNRLFITVMMAAIFSCGNMLAQNAQAPNQKKKLTPEQRQEMQINRMQKSLMLDDETGKGLAVIDLDTVMPGSLCYDFGDSIRFGCNSAAEDEPDTEKMHFVLDLYKTYLDGYLSAVGKGITQREKELLPWGAVLMTYECGMRFLTDYLEGDTYFRTHRERHNLDRAHTQFKLVDEMLACFDKMQAAVK